MSSYTEHAFYNLLFLLYLFSFAIPWNPGGNQVGKKKKQKPLHGCQLQSGRKKNPFLSEL